MRRKVEEMTITPRQDRQTGTAGAGTERRAWPSPWVDVPPSALSEPRLAVNADDRWAGLSSAASEASAPERPLSAPGTATGPHRGPSPLLRMYVERGQSPWLDHLTREAVTSGRLSRMVAAGVRGVTADPTALAKALDVSAEYDEQLSWLFSTGCTEEEAYREVAATDVQAACAVLHPVHQTSQAVDGFVSIEVAPALARRTRGAMAAARRLHQRIDRPNLMVAIPATPQGIPAVHAMVSAGSNINAISIFSIDRYSTVIDAYLSGLETFVAQGGDPATVHGVASLSLGPVDAEVDRRLDGQGGRRAFELRGLAGVAQATLAYRLFEERFSTERWARLANQGGTPQRLMWTSAQTNPTTDPKTGVETSSAADHIGRYVEDLIMPHTIQALSESTVAAMMENGAGTGVLGLGTREAAGVLSDLGAAGIDLDDVGLMLETQTANNAQHSLDGVLSRLQAKWGT